MRRALTPRALVGAISALRLIFCALVVLVDDSAFALRFNSRLPVGTLTANCAAACLASATAPVVMW